MISIVHGYTSDYFDICDQMIIDCFVFQPLPVRNLTAEEYDEIFDAVMKNAESLDIDSNF